MSALRQKLTSAYGVLPPFLSAGTLLDFEVHPALVAWANLRPAPEASAFLCTSSRKPLQAWGSRFGGALPLR